MAVLLLPCGPAFAQCGSSYDPATNIGPVEGNVGRFNGTSNYADVDDGVWFSGGPFTVTAWIRPRAFPYWCRVIDFGNGSPSDNILLAASYETSGQPVFGFYVGGTPYSVVAPNPLPLDRWTHIAGVFDGASITLYENSQPIISAPVPSGPRNLVRTQNYIGHSNWSSDGYFKGDIASVRIYSRALDQTGLFLDSFVEPGQGTNLLADWRWDSLNACGRAWPCMVNSVTGGVSASWVGTIADRTVVTQDTLFRGVADRCRVPTLAGFSTSATTGEASTGSSVTLNCSVRGISQTETPFDPLRARMNFYLNGVVVATRQYPWGSGSSATVGPILPGDNFVFVRYENMLDTTVYSDSATIRIIGRPPLSIAQNPVGATVCPGTAVAFYVGAIGDSPTYQWLFNGLPILGATSSTYVVASASSQNAGNYSCRVTSGASSVISTPAALAIDSASAGDCAGLAALVNPLIAAEVVRSEYTRIDSTGAAPNGKPRLAAVSAAIGVLAAANPRATSAQLSAFVTAYNNALQAAFPDDPDLRRPVDFLAAVRSLSRVAPDPADPNSPIRGLNTDVQAQVLSTLGASIEVSRVDASDARRDNMVNLQSSYTLDFSLSADFAAVLTRAFRGQDDAGRANPLVEPALTAYLRGQGIEPYPASLANYPEVIRALSAMPRTPAQFAAALAGGFQTQRTQAVAALNDMTRAISANIDAMITADRSQGTLSHAIGTATSQPQQIAQQIIAQRQADALRQASARASIGMLSAIMQQGSSDDVVFADQISQAWQSTGRVLRATSEVTQAVVGAGVVGYQAFNWNTERFSWSSLGHGIGGAATAAGILVSMFGPEPLASVVQNILDPINGVRQDIERLRQEMNARFDRVDAELSTILNSVNNGFATVELGQRLTFDQIRGIEFDMFSLQSNLDRLEGNLYGMLNAGFEQSFVSDMNVALGFRDATGADLPYSTPSGSFFSYSTNFRTWANQFSQNALYGGSSTTLLNDATAASVLGFVGADQQVPGGPAVGTPDPLGASLNNLRNFPSRLVSGAPPLATGTVANPNTWSFAADAFERLGRENPWYFAKVYGDQVDANALISTGTASQAVSEQIRTYTLPGGQSIFDRLIADARTRAASFDAALAGSVQAFLFQRNLPGWDLWGPINQSGGASTYQPINLEQYVEPFGLSYASPITMPANLRDRLPIEVQNAVYLRLVYPSAAAAPGGAASGTYLRVTTSPTATYWYTTNLGGFPIYYDIYQVVVPIDVRVRSGSNASSEFISYRELYTYSMGVPSGGPAPTAQQVLDNWNANSGSYTRNDVSKPQLGSLQILLTNAQAALQADFFNDAIAQLHASGTSIANAGQLLESSRALIDAYLSVGLPETFEASDEMRSIVRGSELGLGSDALIAFLQNLSATPPLDLAYTAVPTMAPSWNDRLNKLAAAIAPTHAATYPSESHPLLAYTLASIRGLGANARRLLNDDQYVIAPGQHLTVSWTSGVLANDANQGLDLELRRRPQLVASSLPAGHSFTFTAETRTLADGTTRTNTFGGFTYTPPAGFTGDVILQYTCSVDLSDNSTPNIVTSDPANIRIRVLSCAPVITGQPASVPFVQGEYATFSIAASAPVQPDFQWLRNGAALSDGVTAAGTILVGSASPTLRIISAHPSDEGTYTCAVTTECGQVLSNSAAFGSSCPADIDNSGSLSADDIFAFLNLWFAIDPRADFDHSGTLDAYDIFAFLAAWFAGC